MTNNFIPILLSNIHSIFLATIDIINWSFTNIPIITFIINHKFIFLLVSLSVLFVFCSLKKRMGHFSNYRYEKGRKKYTIVCIFLMAFNFFINAYLGNKTTLETIVFFILLYFVEVYIFSVIAATRKKKFNYIDDREEFERIQEEIRTSRSYETAKENINENDRNASNFSNKEERNAQEKTSYNNTNATNLSASVQSTQTCYFMGCSNMSDLKSRYKNLAKTLHPDCSGGNKEAFELMVKEYNLLSKN